MRLESAPACDSVACSAIFKGRHREAAGAVNGDESGTSPPEGVYQRVAEVKIQEGESIESALRRFKRKVQQEDIIKDIKKHSFYLKPGDKRRAKQALARKRNRKKLRRESE
jgi:small subunit ribosomal protein S21